MEQTPGLILLPKPFRYSVIGMNHTQYDIRGAHLSFVTSIVTQEEAPTHHWLWSAIANDDDKARLYGQLPDGKQSVLAALNNTHHRDTARAYAYSLFSRGHVPGWFLEWVDEMARVYDIIIARLETMGYDTAGCNTNDRNRLWHALAQVEAHLIRGTLHSLRNRLPPFSHGIVHDALFVESTIAEHVVCTEFRNFAIRSGFQHATIPVQTWDDSKTACQEILEWHNYDPKWRATWPTNNGLISEDSYVRMPEYDYTGISCLWDTHAK